MGFRLVCLVGWTDPPPQLVGGDFRLARGFVEHGLPPPSAMVALTVLVLGAAGVVAARPDLTSRELARRGLRGYAIAGAASARILRGWEEFGSVTVVPAEELAAVLHPRAEYAAWAESRPEDFEAAGIRLSDIPIEIRLALDTSAHLTVACVRERVYPRLRPSAGERALERALEQADCVPRELLHAVRRGAALRAFQRRVPMNNRLELFQCSDERSYRRSVERAEASVMDLRGRRTGGFDAIRRE